MARSNCRCFTDIAGVGVQCKDCARIERMVARNKSTPPPHKSPDRQVAGLRRLQAKYRDAARVRGLAWELTEEQAFGLFRSECFYCGAEPYRRDSKDKVRYRDPFVANGIDRIESSGGYTPLNTVPCCFFCNRAKSDRPMSEFMAWAVRFARHTLKDTE